MFVAAIALLVCVSTTLNAQEKVNQTWSPDSTKVAYTMDNDLYVDIVATGETVRITSDGSELILNGYASWVYYEEILGRPSRYRAFWWAPDSKQLGFYRFDNSKISYFPIFSPFGQNGSLNNTRYPKAGQENPAVRIGMVEVTEHAEAALDEAIVWADFDENDDQYFGIPFWGADSKQFFISRMPRVQNTLDLYAVSPRTGKKSPVYHEEYETWIDWMEDVVFTEKGLYMVRAFETGWQQIYFLSYDGATFKRLTSGENWDLVIMKVDEKKGDIWFSAKRDSKVHPAFYKVNKKGVVTALTDPSYFAAKIAIADDGKTFTATLSTASIPWKNVKGNMYKAWNDKKYGLKVTEDYASRYDLSARPLPKLVKIENDGFDLYGLIAYPKDFDETNQYPVVVEIYGGPNTASVRDRFNDRDASDQWCWENGIIWMCVDPRSSGENGRRGADQAYRHMTVSELQDYVAWAKWLQSKPYVKADKICADGFSFGGTSTSMLVFQYPDYFHYGIAGGGVYDFRLYDTHYTERYMDTPQHNPDGYDEACVLNFVKQYDDKKALLRLTHGTGDDNVHFQNTLLLIDALQKEHKHFELMLYPDGMHGYRGYQHEHDMMDRQIFWERNLLR